MLGSPEPEVTSVLNAVHVGIGAGFFTCLSYPLVVFLPLPIFVKAILAACFGPALAVACFGLKGLLDLERPMVSSALGLMLNALGGVLFSAMALVQLAVGSLPSGEKGSTGLNGIWLGMDKAWDAYIGLGTIFFAVAMLRHPRFGRVMGFAGLAIGAGLLLLNLYTFPMPPASAGLVDPGPAIGLWYLIVTIQMWRSLSWAMRRVPANVGKAQTPD
jgi:hypothetical protein